MLHENATIEDRFRAVALQCALSARRERKSERTKSFLCTRSNIFNSRKLNFVHYIFMLLAVLPIPSFLSMLQFLQQVALDVHFHTFISFPSSAELCDVQWKNMKCSVVFPFPSLLPFSSFHAKYLVFL